MGIFSSSKKVYVASSVVQMSESVEDSGRSTFLQKALVSSSLNSSSSNLIGQSIVDVHLRGPRANQRKFMRWAAENYSVGVPKGSLSWVNSIDRNAVETRLEQIIGEDVSINNAFVDNADESYYAERYIFENRPELMFEEWAADYDSASGGILIQYPSGSDPETELLPASALPENFNSSNSVMVIYYTLSSEEAARVFIYEFGSGDSAFEEALSLAPPGNELEFYPYIPLRIDNTAVFDPASPALQDEDIIREAYEKGIGGEIDDLLNEIANNPDIDDIDYAYIVFGVSLNTEDVYGKRYIFEFLNTLAENQEIQSLDYQDYQTAADAEGHNPRVNPYGGVIPADVTAATTAAGFTGLTGLGYGSYRPNAPSNQIHLKVTNDRVGNLDMKIGWNTIEKERKTGSIFHKAKAGDVKLGPGDSFREVVEIPGFNGSTRPIVNQIPGLVVRKQINNLEYEEIRVHGFYHKNLIYDGKSVDITSEEALQDEDLSGFIIPLHEPTLRRLGLIQSTEVALNSSLIVFNSYQVVKKKWYQKGIFKFLLVIVITITVVAISIATGGAGTAASLAASSGILGTAGSIGAALGLTGTLATAVGVAANTLAALIVASVVVDVSQEVLGETIGSIVGVLAALFTVGGLTSVAQGGQFTQGFAQSWSNLGRMDKLLAVTQVGNAVTTAYNQDQIEKILERANEVGSEYEKELERLEKQFESFGFGYGDLLDPLMFTEYSSAIFSGGAQLMGEDFQIPFDFGESPEDFLTRTLLVGEDLIDIAHGMIEEFAEVSLTLPGLEQ